MGTLIAGFTVVGTPVPQGSTRAFAGKGKAAGRAFTTNDPSGKISKWRGDIRSACGTRIVTLGPISVRLVFRFPRPASHYLPVNGKRPERELRSDAPMQPTGITLGDLDKLCRAALDALTGVCYVDDAQVVSLGAVKAYDDFAGPNQPGVDVRVVAL